MKRVLLVALVLMLCAGFARAEGDEEVDKLVPSSAPPAKRTSKPPKPATTDVADDVAPTEDNHFIQRDDYFIAEQALDTSEWIYVMLSKMVTAPTKQTKGEGEFFKITDGNKQWTKHYWKTRKVDIQNIKLGTVVISFEGNSKDGMYQAPEAKDSARSANWFMAKVTDMSDLYKGYITVSGGYKISPKNLRVPVK